MAMNTIPLCVLLGPFVVYGGFRRLGGGVACSARACHAAPGGPVGPGRLGRRGRLGRPGVVVVVDLVMVVMVVVAVEFSFGVHVVQAVGIVSGVG